MEVESVTLEGEWMELGIIILREVTRAQKGKHHTLSLICGYHLWICGCVCFIWNTHSSQDVS